MRILLLSAREPVHSGRGDQHRAWCLATELGREHEVTVVELGLAGDSSTPATRLHGVRVVRMHASSARRALAVLAGLPRGLPGQTSWTRAGIRRHELDGLCRDHDVVLAVTSRTLDGPLDRPTVLDHIDALSLNMARRARIDPSRAKRVAARAEARLLRRHERRLARWVGGQIVTTADDAAALPATPPPLVLPPVTDVPIHEGAGERPVDVILTGNMRYPPNRRAYAVLVDEVLPVLRETLPAVRVRVVGRHADALPRADGVEIASDVPDMGDELRAAKVAIAPVEGGTGAPQKLLEAAASGCAVVAPSWALAAFALPGPGAESGREIAARTVALLADEGARTASVAGALQAVRDGHRSALAGRVEPVLRRAGAQPPRPARA